MGDIAAQARAVLEGRTIGFEDLLRLFTELEQQGEFVLGREVTARVKSSFSPGQQRQLTEKGVHFADLELQRILKADTFSISDLEAPFALLEREQAWLQQWQHARIVVSRLRNDLQDHDAVKLKLWKIRLETALRELGPQIAERPAKIESDLIEPLIKDLKGILEFGLARIIIEKSRDALPQKRREWFWQQLALCTYKDEELIPRERFKRALEILDEIPKVIHGSLDEAESPTATQKVDQASNLKALRETSETLALRGAVYKRMWELGGQVDNLYEAAKYYLQAWSQDHKSDMGYGGVNAAYLVDILASLEEPITSGPAEDLWLKESWSTRARELREQMKKELPSLADDKTERQYWYRVTMAEIHWGLEEWEKAGDWLALARENDTSEWELQTTVKQLVSMARLRGVPSIDEKLPEFEWHTAWRALKKLTGEDTPRVVTCHRGKVGLALSGGGFRASLFHLGVLARLAEMDVLRSIEVLSTVSGGSIVGAHYYLALRNLLQKHPDGDLKAGDYVDLVKTVQEAFMEAIQNNLRTRALSNLFCNLKFVLPGFYTRSNRMGELYEDYIFSRVEDDHPKDKPRLMRDLLIHPCVNDSNGKLFNDRTFKPKFSNWRRRAKVPILLLNTTSLNTGHNWHFTARWMGEPPGLLGPETEMIPRYRRLWYDDAPTEELRQYRIGYAVAASACVPGLFEPLELRDLYPGRTVRLVDGGVHDNQGVAGLLDESCTLILCSDASGQMSDKPKPSNSILGVPLRSNSILMDRVRESEYLDLRSRVDSRALQGLFFVHLKQELNQDPITWVGGKIKEHRPQNTTTSYQVDRDLQAELADIRTDLDSFSEVEAYALMTSGYLMTKREIERLNEAHIRKGGKGTWGDFAVHAPSRGADFWRFLKLAPLLLLPHGSSDSRRADLGRQLKASSSHALKAFKLSPVLSAVGLGLSVLVAIGLGYLVYNNWNQEIAVKATVGGVLLTVLIIAGGLIWRGIRIANPQAVMRSWIFKSVLAIGGWIIANLHLLMIDWTFMKRGKLKRLMRLRAE